VEFAETKRKTELEFSEFVETISTYCTFTREDILRCELLAYQSIHLVCVMGWLWPTVCFFIFDKDKNGFIERVSSCPFFFFCVNLSSVFSNQEELVSLVAVLHDHAVDKAITSAIDSMDTNKDGIVTFGPCFPAPSCGVRSVGETVVSKVVFVLCRRRAGCFPQELPPGAVSRLPHPSQPDAVDIGPVLLD
jgi:hypothetical protein